MDRMASDLTRNGPVERDIELVNFVIFLLYILILAFLVYYIVL